MLAFSPKLSVHRHDLGNKIFTSFRKWDFHIIYPGRVFIFSRRVSYFPSAHFLPPPPVGLSFFRCSFMGFFFAFCLAPFPPPIESLLMIKKCRHEKHSVFLIGNNLPFVYVLWRDYTKLQTMTANMKSSSAPALLALFWKSIKCWHTYEWIMSASTCKCLISEHSCVLSMFAY